MTQLVLSPVSQQCKCKSRIKCRVGHNDWDTLSPLCNASVSFGNVSKATITSSISNMKSFGVEADMPSLPVFPVDYLFFTYSTSLPVGKTFLPVFAILGNFFSFYR